MDRFLIWFQQRSGSSHLVSMLNSHAEIKCKGEVFGCYPVGRLSEQKSFPAGRRLGDNLYRRRINLFPGHVEDPTDEQCRVEVQRLLGSEIELPSKIKQFGFKLKFPSQASLFPAVRQYLESHSKSLRIIVLTRKNYLQRAISNLNLKRLQHLTDRSNVNESLDLPPEVFDVTEVIRLIRYYQEIETDFLAWPRQFEHRFEIDYDELVNDSPSAGVRLLEYLEVSSDRQLRSKLKKVGPKRLEEVVNNADELKLALSENGFSYDW